MHRSNNMGDIELRVTLAERALAEMTSRFSELANALAAIADVRYLPDEKINEPVTVTAETVSPFAIGFYQCERDDAQRPYRWTGNGSLFELRFRLNRDREWAFAMEVKPNEHVDMSSLRAFVDYLEIPVQIDESLAFVRGVLPARLFSRTAILTFYLPSAFIPSKIDPAAEDNRTLGIVFYGISIDPYGPVVSVPLKAEGASKKLAPDGPNKDLGKLIGPRRRRAADRHEAEP